MEEVVLDSDYGYGEWGNVVKILRMQKLSTGEQKVYVKKLWLEDPKSYYKWKEDCIRLNMLPDFLVHVIILFLLMNPNYNITFFMLDVS